MIHRYVGGCAFHRTISKVAVRFAILWGYLSAAVVNRFTAVMVKTK
jgi:hypothetical protein